MAHPRQTVGEKRCPPMASPPPPVSKSLDKRLGIYIGKRLGIYIGKRLGNYIGKHIGKHIGKRLGEKLAYVKA